MDICDGCDEGSIGGRANRHGCGRSGFATRRVSLRRSRALSSSERDYGMPDEYVRQGRMSCAVAWGNQLPGAGSSGKFKGVATRGSLFQQPAQDGSLRRSVSTFPKTWSVFDSSPSDHFRSGAGVPLSIRGGGASAPKCVSETIGESSDASRSESTFDV